MLELNDGRSELWQWDTGRTLAVDADCSQVHFSNKVFGRSIDVDVAGGVAIIPDVLLQTDKDLNIWAFVGTAENGYTKISKTFKVNRRNKPADYVFTPTDQTTLAELSGRLDRIEESQDPDAIKNAVEDYLEQNPVEVPVKSVNGKTGTVELNPEDVGAISRDDLQEATNEALAQAKASGDFDGADGAPGKDGADGQPGENGTDGYSPTANVTQNDNGAIITITDKNGTTMATITNGKDGADGSPGKDGADGKSAYQYAQDGGYTGTEEAFAAKLAQEMPTTLPNPNALTFTGAVTGSYDGSAPVSVEIPSGGGGSAYELPVASATQLGGVMPVAKTDEMTQAVGVDAEGGLWALPGGGSMKMELLAELRGDGEGISFSATFDGIEKLGLYLLHFKVDGADAENAGNSLYAKFGGSGIWASGIRSISVATTNNQYDSKALIMLIATDGLGNAYLASGAERGLSDSLGFTDSENKIINGVVSLYSQNSKPVFSGASVRLWRLL